ncbi:uncharacterized protein Eint_040360 [Encephalitozoon intestinalis ATCC 50506]|uniref:Uncharacterized protein n=1 Tax=Encephalitozoon intestinalis (strain ATCC 50506) TaxID=876142 RepID=E0S6J2_ENCIT|nr:uncharacterized protein Eint_040360 [Encephalitozoon intestinalis ATCC 50506]ADM11327.2 hypothetical protein Eint_040360 [Encephalitozoon intestinalis ATCC 50506]UTX45014.1 hypothetical protein GPK93_04g05490 [Encephalitozoon intestinalis]
MEISHIVFLDNGDTSKVNQQVVCGKYLVFNSPWDDSQADTKIKRDGRTLDIESKEIILKVASGKIVYLETVYPVSTGVEFVELISPPNPYDFFLLRKHFLSKLTGVCPRPMEKEVTYPKKRRIGCFIMPVILCILRKPLEYFLVNIPSRIVDYIMNSSVEEKQIITIKTTLGAYVKFFTTIQSLFLRLGFPVVFIDGIYMIPTAACLSIFSRLGLFLAKLLVESIHLLNNSSYNPLKKRRDSVVLNTDQIFMSVLIFSFLLLITFNVVHFYVLYIFMNLCLIALTTFSDFIDFVLIDISKFHTYTLSTDHTKHRQIKLKYTKVSIYHKIKFAIQASLLSSKTLKDTVLAKYLLEIK